jgi:hypothetical protein
MKRVTKWFLGVAMMAVSLSGAEISLAYKLKSGQTWRCEQATVSQSEYMGQKSVSKSRSVIEYRTAKGPKSGWVSVTGRILSQSQPEGGSPMEWSKVTFTADIHRSGETRNIHSAGSPMPEPQGGLPPEMKAMYAQSAAMVTEAWEHAVFWLPELPDYPLREGDEFEVERELGMGGSGSAMASKTVMRQVFTLEEVSQGLAYFSVKERSLTQTKGTAGGSSDTKVAGRGEAVFDLELGMWLELEEKSRAKVTFGGMMGMDGGSSQMQMIHRYTMTLQ